MQSNVFLTVLDETTSTNLIARQRAENGAPEGTVIQAKRQTAGRGRRGNNWESPEGNVYASFIFRPDVDAATAGQLSFLIGIAVAETLADFLPKNKRPELKWPNDVLIDGKKIAGILLESELGTAGRVKWVVAGVGVNLVPVTIEHSTCLEAEGGGKVEAAAFLENLSGRILDWMNIWRGFGFEPLRKAWMDLATGHGGPITARLPSGELNGVFSGMDSSGALILSLPDGGERLISSGEVFFG